MQQGSKGLGRGLEALLGDAAITDIGDKKEEKLNSGIRQIDINKIMPNESQPRKDFDAEKIDDLAASIREHGVIQPIIVRNKGNGFEIVAGERRWRASRAAGIKEIPCIVKNLTDKQNIIFAIIENLQREDLNPIEEAEGFQNMLKAYDFTQEEISKSVGKSRPYIANQMRLLKLPKKIRDYLSEGNLSMGHGRALLALDSEEKQLYIAKKVVEKGLSVREVEKMVKNDINDIEYVKSKVKDKKEKNHEVLLVERELKDKFGTKVNIEEKGKKGKIEIEYYSREDLDRLIEILMKI